MNNSTIPYIVGFLASFMLELQESLFAVGFLIAADSFTGIWASWKEGIKIEGSIFKGWSHITSRRAARILIKLILYPLALIVAKVAEDHLTPAVPWIDVTAGILAVIEVKSIFENIGDILGFNLWKKIAVKLWPDKVKDSDFTDEEKNLNK